MSQELIERLEASGLNPDQIADIVAVHEDAVTAAKPKRRAPGVSLGTKDKAKGGKGTVCVYGLSVNAFGQWYPSQWVRFLHFACPDTFTKVHEYILKNSGILNYRTDEEKDAVLDACRALAPVEDEDEDEDLS